jgi:hypothetical protein
MEVIEKLGLDQPETVTPQQTEAEREEFLNQFVGEGKKYKSVEDLAKAYYNIEKHTEIVKRENEEYRNKLQELQAKEKTVEEILEAVAEQPQVETPQPTIDPNQIEQLVTKTIEKKTQEQIEQEMRMKSKEKLLSAFGDSKTAVEKIKSYVGNDMRKQQIVDTLTATDPDGLVSLLGGNKTVEHTPTIPTQPSTRNITPTNIHNLEITWSQAKELRDKDPRAYKQMQSKIHASAAKAEEMGIDYFTT